jgi:hypothetical protein
MIKRIKEGKREALEKEAKNEKQIKRIKSQKREEWESEKYATLQFLFNSSKTP